MFAIGLIVFVFACLLLGAFLLAVEMVREWSREDPELRSSRPQQQPFDWRVG